MDAFKEAWRRANPKIKAELLYRCGVHEAGHAVAWWALDQMRYLGRYVTLPHLSHVAISLDGGEIQGSRGMHADLDGVCAADPCFWWPWTDPLPRDFSMARGARRSASCDIVRTMAGPIAERFHDGDPYQDAYHWRCEESERSLDAEGGERGTDSWHVECSIAVLGRRWRLHLERAFALADQIVRGHQPHIHALAKALVTRGLVEGEEVEAIFQAQGAVL
jgi:hypothetical protein